jgi:hypothetical protein
MSNKRTVETLMNEWIFVLEKWTQYVTNHLQGNRKEL